MAGCQCAVPPCGVVGIRPQSGLFLRILAPNERELKWFSRQLQAVYSQIFVDLFRYTNVTVQKLQSFDFTNACFLSIKIKLLPKKGGADIFCGAEPRPEPPAPSYSGNRAAVTA